MGAVLGGMGSKCRVLPKAAVSVLSASSPHPRHTCTRKYRPFLKKKEKEESDFHGNLATYITKVSKFTFLGVYILSLLPPDSPGS